MKHRGLLLILIIILAILGYYYYASEEVNNVPQEENTNVTEVKEENNEVAEERKEEVDEVVYAFSGELEDVTKGEEVAGIITDNKATGVAKAGYGEKYNMIATFENLPDPQGTAFYEGWIVRKGIRFSVLSTGKAEKVDGKYVNNFKSIENLTDHDFYVLTIEPDDGNPEPAEHILEGTMKEVR